MEKLRLIRMIEGDIARATQRRYLINWSYWTSQACVNSSGYCAT